MKLLKDRFCSLSRSKEFQVFLKKLDPKLYQELINHLQLNEGCDSNKDKMSKIHAQIKKDSKELELIEFMQERYPHMVVKTSKKPQEVEPKTKVKKMVAATSNQLYDKMNHHKVFNIYRPKLFFVPQRRIFVGPSRNEVLNSINRFIRTKLDSDYLILEGPELWHGYVEFFDVRFREHIKKLDINQKSLVKYRKVNGIK
jgi:hypothetical protein